MKKYLYIFSMMCFFIIAFSCQQGNFNFEVNCAECFTSKPDSADIIAYLTFNDLNDSIPLVFYRGKYNGNPEKDVLEWRDTATVAIYSDGKYFLRSPVNEYYSLKATYKTKNGKTVVAVDGDKFSTNHVTDVCDTDCWIVKGGILDVRLKYE
jgi:hypothetical protein